MSKWVKAVAAVVAIGGVVILLYAVLTPQQTTDSTDHMGMFGGHMSYSSGNVGLIALSSVMIVIALMVIILWQEYEPLPQSFAPSAIPFEGGQAQVANDRHESEEQLTQVPTPAVDSNPEEVMAREYLVLRLLTGDERIMYKAIMDSGGEALQKDLISNTKMSNAKVSRLLDKLEQKGVVTKDRHGATNKIRIKSE